MCADVCCRVLTSVGSESSLTVCPQAFATSSTRKDTSAATASADTAASKASKASQVGPESVDGLLDSPQENREKADARESSAETDPAGDRLTPTGGEHAAERERRDADDSRKRGSAGERGGGGGGGGGEGVVGGEQTVCPGEFSGLSYIDKLSHYHPRNTIKTAGRYVFLLFIKKGEGGKVELSPEALKRHMCDLNRLECAYSRFKSSSRSNF
jgi:hypothetical protein